MIAEGIAGVRRSGPPLTAAVPTLGRASEAIRAGRTYDGAHTRHSPHMRAYERAHDVTDWRRRRLEQAGFPAPLARRLARERGRDRHALIELAERGCPPDLAVRIVLPGEAPAS